MRKQNAVIATALVALMASGTGAVASGLFTNGVPNAGGTQYPTTVPLTGNEQLPADTELSNGQNPASEAITTSQLAAFAGSWGDPRNFLDNGAMAVNQQGTSSITGGTTSITALEFAADRWFVDTNVTSGAGHGQIITASPAPPASFTQSVKIWRASGALTQPVCMIQEIPTARSTALAGQNVVFSGYFQPLAGLTSANGDVKVSVITGTGTDEGLATLTASPAITPAWTGIATANTTTFALGTTAAWSRYYTGAVAIPATATEVGVEVCFTPVGSSSGATDGFAMTGLQLEQVGSAVNAPVAASSFENHPYEFDLIRAQRFFYELKEPASGAAVDGFCQATGASANTCTVYLPVTMRGTTPTITIGTAGTFKVNIAGTPTTFATPTAGVCSITSCTVTGANTNSAGQAEQLTGGGGTGVWTISSDVVM